MTHVSNDGGCNDLDTDDDSDGWSDPDEIACGSDPLLASSVPEDSDGDDSPDCFDGCPYDQDKTTPGICGCGLPDVTLGDDVTTVIAYVSASSDDAEENVIQTDTHPAGDVYLDSSDLEITSDIGYARPEQIVGLRFKDVQVPHAALIQNAYIEFVADGKSAQQTDLIIRVQATDNANTFIAQNYDISNRPLVESIVNWNRVSPWSKGHTYQTFLEQRHLHLTKR